MPRKPKTNTTPQWILVTGQPGSGKTTAVKKLVEYLQSRGHYCRGFYTDEVLDPKSKAHRIGFDVVTVPDNQRGVLSRKPGHGIKSSKFQTGKYLVDVESFEKLALPSLTGSGFESPSKKRKINSHHDSNESSSSPEKKQGHNNPQKNCILVLDEIGRMELHSKAFEECVRNLLAEGSNRRLVGAVTAPIYGHRVAFCDEVTVTEGVEVHKLTKKTRDDVVKGLLEEFVERKWVADNTTDNAVTNHK